MEVRKSLPVLTERVFHGSSTTRAFFIQRVGEVKSASTVTNEKNKWLELKSYIISIANAMLSGIHRESSPCMGARDGI